LYSPTAAPFFLDEIGELPLDLQAKLLKVIEDGKLERLGSPHPVKVDVRIIAFTHRNLKEARWKVEGARGAAKLLGMNPSTLRARMRKLGIKRPKRSKSSSTPPTTYLN